MSHKKYKQGKWSELETNYLLNHYPRTPNLSIANSLNRKVTSVLAKAASLGLKKDERYLNAPSVNHNSNKDNGMRFNQGHIPWNKGTKGLSTGGVSTQFKAGNLPPNHVPVGTEVVKSDGYLKRKIAEPNVWQYTHILNWEAVNGKVPDNHVITFIDGNKANCDNSNLACVTKKDILSRNTIHRYPADVKHAMRLNAKLKRTIRGIEDEQ